jgi:cytochrome c biogenesis protein CcdA
MGLSFLRGLVAAVNPCGFVLLPTYLVFFLGLEHQQGLGRGGAITQRATVRRALLVSASLSAGFMAVFVSAGLVSYHLTDWINRNAKYATVVIGVVLVALGVSMLLGFRPPIVTPKLDAGGRERTVRSMFVYGVAYAVASIGCTIGLFIATLLATRREGVVNGVLNVALYGLGFSLLVTALTVTLAVANTGLLRVLRSGSRYVEAISAVLVVLSGAYLLYYFWVVDVNEDSDPVTRWVETLQNDVLTRLSDSWQATAVVLGAIVVVAVAFVLWRRDPASDTSSGADDDARELSRSSDQR